MMLNIKQIIESKYKANSYVIIEGNDCIIIYTNINTPTFITANNLNPIFLFLTHEHFDHVKGSAELKKCFQICRLLHQKLLLI